MSTFRGIFLTIFLLCILMTNAFAQYYDAIFSVTYDSLDNRYFASSNNNNVVLQIDSIGNATIFTDEIEYPLGVTIVDSILYVCGNKGSNGGVFGFDLEDASQVFEISSPDWFNIAINVAADTSGFLYLSGTPDNLIRIDLATQTYEAFPYGEIQIPLGLYFDKRLNRLLVSDLNEAPIYELLLTDSSIRPLTTLENVFGGITEDYYHNYYFTKAWGGGVYRVDSSFSSEPELIVITNESYGLCYNHLYRTLCIGKYGPPSGFLYYQMDLDIGCTVDTTHGNVPLTVQFNAFSELGIIDWYWEFGDGYTANGILQTHEYATPGMYAVTLHGITAVNDTITRIYPHKIYAQADTIWAENIMGKSGTTVNLQIYGKTTAPVGTIVVPIDYNGDAGLKFDSIRFNDCILATFDTVIMHRFDTANKQIAFIAPYVMERDSYTPAFSGELANVYFTISGIDGASTYISFDGISGTLPRFSVPDFSFTPATIGAKAQIEYLCGDIFLDGTVNIGDAVYLINYIFKGGFPPAVPDAADPNCDESINIGDAVYMIRYIFQGGSEPCANCPVGF